MKHFKLPDLGEGLPDAEIREWHVKPGQAVKKDDVLVSMETAKAVVDVPSPFTGTIESLHGEPGDVIRTGSTLVTFEGEQREDSGTVVGVLEQQEGLFEEDVKIIKSGARASSTRATPAVLGLANRLGIDINAISGTGPNGMVTAKDLKSHQHKLPEGYEALKGSRRMMMQAMVESHSQVCPVTIFDDADISGWAADEDITVRLIRAVVAACVEEPAMNAYFDGKAHARLVNKHVNLGIAVDSTEGLFVPVIHEAEKLIENPKGLRDTINRFKSKLKDRSLEPHDLSGATITLSNFGTFAGRYATPVVVPPQVAIIGCGAKREAIIAKDGKPTVATILPISVTFDHRAVTGGESTRFLAAVLRSLK